MSGTETARIMAIAARARQHRLRQGVEELREKVRKFREASAWLDANQARSQPVPSEGQDFINDVGGVTRQRS